MTKEYRPELSVYTPDQASGMAIKAVERMANNKQRGAHLGIEMVGDYFAPVLPGQVCAVIGQTSNYKSAFLHAWQRDLAEQLAAEEREEVIISVSTEEVVEEQVYLQLAHETGEEAGSLARGQVQNWDRLKAASVRIATIPIFRIGDSLARPENMSELYMSNMIKSIEALTSGSITGTPMKPAALFFDYLQAFPFDPEVRRSSKVDQRRLQVREDIYRLRQASLKFDCPVIVAVQAKQNLDGAKGDFQIPGMYDGEESSSIAQRSDRVITLWMPAKTHPPGYNLRYGNICTTVTEEMLFVRVAKQRGGLPSGKIFECHVDFTRNQIVPA